MEHTRALTSGPEGREPGLLYPVLLILAAAVSVLSVIGIAAMMGLLPGRDAPPSATAAAASGADAPGAALCFNCGTVSAIRVREREAAVPQAASRPGVTTVGASPAAPAGARVRQVNYEILIRMSDGSYRTFFTSSQPALAVGAAVRVTEEGLDARR